MRVSVLVPSEEYKSYAGARIRYGRIGPQLVSHGIELSVQNIREFDPQAIDADVLLISKCHDAQALVAAAAASKRGRLVGVDLFDDYFSQKSDARLSAHRNWLSQLVRICDFALCSTEDMAEVVRDYRADLALHVLNDPAPHCDLELISTRVAMKLREARDEQRIKLVWFGVGDNPYFPVGLSDLLAHAGVLGPLSRSGMAVDLKILTNRRSLTADGLSMINQLPFGHQVDEWSEENERRALGDALLAFLPVNAQSFSSAKSLNRALSALSNGCQVLSAGYPLYEPLASFIYRTAECFLHDLDRSSVRLSARTVRNYGEVLAKLASDREEARRLAIFLSGLGPQLPDRVPICLVHGQSTREEAHNLVKVAKGLSVASPFCTAPFDFDIVFRGSPFDLDMFVSREALRRFPAEATSKPQSWEVIQGRHYLRVSIDRSNRSGGAASTVPHDVATYGRTISEIENRMLAVFGPCRTLISETSALPFAMSKAS